MKWDQAATVMPTPTPSNSHPKEPTLPSSWVAAPEISPLLAIRTQGHSITLNQVQIPTPGSLLRHGKQTSELLAQHRGSLLLQLKMIFQAQVHIIVNHSYTLSIRLRESGGKRSRSKAFSSQVSSAHSLPETLILLAVDRVWPNQATMMSERAWASQACREAHQLISCYWSLTRVLRHHLPQLWPDS